MTATKPNSDNLSTTNVPDRKAQPDLKKIRYAELDAEYIRQSRKLRQVVERLKKRGLGRNK